MSMDEDDPTAYYRYEEGDVMTAAAATAVGHVGVGDGRLRVGSGGSEIAGYGQTNDYHQQMTMPSGIRDMGGYDDNYGYGAGTTAAMQRPFIDGGGSESQGSSIGGIGVGSGGSSNSYIPPSPDRRVSGIGGGGLVHTAAGSPVTAAMSGASSSSAGSSNVGGVIDAASRMASMAAASPGGSGGVAHSPGVHHTPPTYPRHYTAGSPRSPVVSASQAHTPPTPSSAQIYHRQVQQHHSQQRQQQLLTSPSSRSPHYHYQSPSQADPEDDDTDDNSGHGGDGTGLGSGSRRRRNDDYDFNIARIGRSGSGSYRDNHAINRLLFTGDDGIDAGAAGGSGGDGGVDVDGGEPADPPSPIVRSPAASPPPRSPPRERHSPHRPR